MADTKISDLAAVTTVADTDEYVVARSGGTKKITGANLKAGMPTGGAPTGTAGGVLSGTYPNPGFAADMATQAELNAVAATIPAPGATDLDDLTDVVVSGGLLPADEDALCWDATSVQWQPKKAVMHRLADAKGDLPVASNDDVFGRLAVGTDGQVLTADSAQTLGVKWAAAAAAGGAVWRTGTAAPSDTVGVEGDLYLDITAKKIYIKQAIPGTTTYFGYHIGAGTGDFDASTDTKYTQPYAATVSGNVTTGRMRIKGFGTVSHLKMVVYANSGGVPGALLGVSNPVTVGASDPYAWLDFTFGTPFAVVSGTTYHIGWHMNEYGLAIRMDLPATLDTNRNFDSYSDGPADPFGTPITNTLWTFGMEIGVGGASSAGYVLVGTLT